MNRNVGFADRSVRYIVAIVICALLIVQAVTGPAAIALGALAVVMGVTAALGRCPLYALFGLSSCPAERRKKVE